MPACGDPILAVVGLHGKYELLALHGDQLDSGRDGETDRRRRLVADVDVRPDRLLVWPVDVRVDGPDAGPFDQPDEESGGEKPPA